MLEVKCMGAFPYSFQDEKTGRLVEGVNVFYEATREDGVGIIPQKLTLPYSEWDNIQKIVFPSICSPRVTQDLTARGVKTKVIGLVPVGK